MAHTNDGYIQFIQTGFPYITAKMADPAFYQQDSAKITRVVNQLKEMQADLARAYT